MIKQNLLIGKYLQSLVTFRPSARLLFFGNKIYEIPHDGDAQAIYDRIQLLIGSPKKFRHTKDEIKNIIQHKLQMMNFLDL